jgi:hypothetical protein
MQRAAVPTYPCIAESLCLSSENVEEEQRQTIPITKCSDASLSFIEPQARLSRTKV